MTSDTHGPTFGILAGVLKRKRYSTAPFRQSPLKMILNGAKAQRERHKKNYPITLPTAPFDYRSDDQ